MYESLVRHVIALTPEDLVRTNLENIALCAAWYDSFIDDQQKLAPYAHLRLRLDQWVNGVVAREDNTAGKRQQPLLRTLINELKSNQLQDLQRDEVNFLYFALALARRPKDKNLFKHPIDFIAPYFDDISKLRIKLDAVPGLQNVAQRLRVFTPNDLQQGGLRDIKVFAGISIPIRGPVLTNKGNTKIVGTIPQDCVMVVEEGNCHVDGKVMGKLAATGSCEIHDTITGVVIARRGDVRARSILNQALAISKESSVHCIDTHEPKLVFGCKEINIATTATSGTYLGRILNIGEEIIGGTIQVSELANAKAFSRSDERPLSIVLRRGISCQDYGEQLTAGANSILSNALRLRQRLLNIEDLLNMAEREADEYAGNVLIFLLGEDDSSSRAGKIQKMRRRTAFLDRLDVGIKAMKVAVEDRVQSADDNGNSREQSDPSAGGEERLMIEELRKELTMLSAEGAIDRDLFEEREQVMAFGRKLQRRNITRRGMLQILDRLLDKGQALRKMRSEIAIEMEKREDALQRIIEKASIINRAKEECSRVEVLHQLVNASRMRGGNEIFRERCKDRYVKLMQRNVENRISRGAGYRLTIMEIEGSIQKLRDKLWDEYQVSLPNHLLEGWAIEGIRAHGAFGPAVWIGAWPHLLEERTTDDPGITITTDSNCQTVTYRRSEHATIERC